MCMLEVILEGILTNHNDIKSLTKNLNTIANLLCIGYLATNIYICKKMKKQNIQISELKKELEEIKAKGE